MSTDPLRPPPPAGPAQRITTARRPHSVDIRQRMRAYAVSMGIRTACVICFAVIDHWSRWLFVAGAVFLPYVAVLLANAGRERVPGRPVAQLLPAETVRPALPAPAPTGPPPQRDAA